MRVSDVLAFRWDKLGGCGMKRLILAMTLAAGAAQADPGAIRGAIDGQIAAFRAADVDTAFTFAAPGIVGMFRTPENFGAMVRQGYPMVWEPGSVEYLGVEDRGGDWTQDVLVTDAAGRLYTLEYTMVETERGWKIAGVRMLTDPDVGA